MASFGSRHPELLISNLNFNTDTKLGRGADATVYEVEWNGTQCAAKRLHEALLEDESPGGATRLIDNFESECVTWSKLRHPGVVQFLGVHLERSSRLPILVMEKMDISLRTYLEEHSNRKAEFPLHLKVIVLRQVSQALAYLHHQSPPLVHHDLSPNNVLMNLVTFVTKVSDFGMSRVINPSKLTRKSSVKGTLAFMPPEALQTPPRYNDKLDVFSFGNVIIATLTHKWPVPAIPNQMEGGKLVALTELQRRDCYVATFTVQERQLFLPIVDQCLENQPDKRPSSASLVHDLRRIESSLPRANHVTAPAERPHQEVGDEEDGIRQMDDVIWEKDEALKQKDATILAQRAAIQQQKRQLFVGFIIVPLVISFLCGWVFYSGAWVDQTCTLSTFGDLAAAKRNLSNTKSPLNVMSCKVNHQSEVGAIALHLAAAGGHVNLIRHIAPKMESLLNSVDTYQCTMLHWAAQNGHVDVVRVVIDSFHLNTAKRDKWAFTPVLRAALYGHTTVVDLLVVRYGCSLTDMNTHGRNALHLAAVGGHVDTVQYLAVKMQSALHSTDNNGYTLLHLAAQGGHAGVVRLAIEELKLDPNKGCTPLLRAAYYGQTEIIDRLVESYNCSLSDINDDDNSALHLAAGRGYLPTVKYLLPLLWDRRFDKNRYGQTCLELAQRWRAMEVVAFLTEQGLDTSIESSALV